MLGVNLKNKQQKHAFIVGAAVGVFAGAFLPDKYNPVELVKRMLNRESAF